MNKETLLNIFIIILAVLLCLSVFRCVNLKHQLNDLRYQVENIKTHVDSVLITKYDTVKIETPVYKTKEIIRHDTTTIDNIIFVNDTGKVVIPIEQKYYEKDSVYKAWVSGWSPQLDSIYVYNKTITNTITNTVVKKKKTHFGIGPSVGVSYDMLSKKPAPYIGIGINYNIFSW